MSSTSFDTAEITRTATALTHLAAATKTTGISTTVSLALNKSWGADAIGAAFAGVYEPAAGTVMRNVLDAAPHLGEIADKLAASAEHYATTEQVNSHDAAGVDH